MPKSRIEMILERNIPSDFHPQSRVEELLLELIQNGGSGSSGGSIRYKGSVDFVNELPDDAQEGDVYYVEDTKQYMMYINEEWSTTSLDLQVDVSGIPYYIDYEYPDYEDARNAFNSSRIVYCKINSELYIARQVTENIEMGHGMPNVVDGPIVFVCENGSGIRVRSLNPNSSWSAVTIYPYRHYEVSLRIGSGEWIVDENEYHGRPYYVFTDVTLSEVDLIIIKPIGYAEDLNLDYEQFDGELHVIVDEIPDEDAVLKIARIQ